MKNNGFYPLNEDGQGQGQWSKGRKESQLVQVSTPHWSPKTWHASQGDPWHIPHATRVPRSRKRKPQKLTSSLALLLITQMYLRISQMSFLTHQNPKDTLKES